MSIRAAVAVAALFCLALTAHLHAQVRERDYSAIFRELVVAFADYHHLNMQEVFVDSVLSGRPHGSAPLYTRERVLPVSTMQELATTLGFRLTGHVRTFSGRGGVADSPLSISRRAAIVTVIGPTITGDSATANVGSLINEPEKNREVSEIMRFTFARQSGSWKFVKAYWETGEVRKR